MLDFAPDTQEQILLAESVDGVEPRSKRELQAVAYAGRWVEQRESWRKTRSVKTT